MKRNECKARRRAPSKPLRPFGDGNGHAANGHAKTITAAPIIVLPTEPKPTAPVTSDGRDAAGRFVRGNRGGPGNPFARQVAVLRSAFLGTVTPERIRSLADQLYDCAMKGDTAAAKLLLGYTLGNPAAAVDPDRLDLDELRVIMERPLNLQIMLQAMYGVDAPAAIEFLALADWTPTKILDSIKDQLTNLNYVLPRVLQSRAKKT